MIDGDGFLFCKMTVTGRKKLERIVAKYKTIHNLTFEVREIR